MQNERIPASRLVILYLLNSLDITLNELQLVRILTENDWANYFDIKENLFELAETGMLKRIESPNGVFYYITPAGKDSLSLFYKDIRHSVRESLDLFSRQNRDDLNHEADLYSDYIKVSDDEFRVILRILDKTLSVFEITQTAYSKDQAETMIKNWKNASSVIYKSAYTELIKE